MRIRLIALLATACTSAFAQSTLCDANYKAIVDASQNNSLLFERDFKNRAFETVGTLDKVSNAILSINEIAITNSRQQ